MGQSRDRTIKRLSAAWLKQDGRCIYCEVVVPLGFVMERPEGMPMRLWRQVRGTIEHVHRRSEGGPDKAYNRVMACAHCNHVRQATPAMQHKENMMWQMGALQHPCHEAKLFKETIYAIVRGALLERKNIGATRGVLHAQADQGIGSGDHPG